MQNVKIIRQAFNVVSFESAVFFPKKKYQVLNKYVVVVPRCKGQHRKCFLNFSYFATYFASEIIAKYEKRGKYLPI